MINNYIKLYITTEKNFSNYLIKDGFNKYRNKLVFLYFFVLHSFRYAIFKYLTSNTLS